MEKFLRSWTPIKSNIIEFDSRGLLSLFLFMKNNAWDINSPILLVYDGSDAGRFPMACNNMGLNMISVINNHSLVWIARTIAIKYNGIDPSMFRYSNDGWPPFTNSENYFDHILFLSDIDIDRATSYIDKFSSNRAYTINSGLAQDIYNKMNIDQLPTMLRFSKEIKLWQI